MQRLVIEYLNLLFGGMLESEHHWDEIQEKLLRKFENALTEGKKKNNHKVFFLLNLFRRRT
jgi:hypothetical protein